MSFDGHLFLLSVIAFSAGLVFFFAGLAFFVLHLHRRRTALRPEPGRPQPTPHPVPIQSGGVRPAPTSPLNRIRFKQAFESDGLSEAVLEFGRETLNLGLLGQGANFAIRSIEAGKRIGGMDLVLRFGGRGIQLAQEGEVSIPMHGAVGRWLPELQDRGGRFVELASGSSEVLGTLANVSALVVSVAYMVASRDTLRRLRHIESRIDELLAGRRSERIARLERIYVKSGELLCTLPYGVRSHQLDTFQSELYELRAGWRREIECMLDAAPDPSARRSWATKLVRYAPIIGGAVEWSNLRARKPRERQLYEHLLPIVDIVRCLRLALLVDVCIAQWNESVDLLFQHTLGNEFEMWEGIAAKLEEQARQFQSAKAPKYRTAIMPAVEAIRAYTDALDGTLPKDALFSPHPVRASRRSKKTTAIRTVEPL